jgi:hypothetical protein
MAFIQGTRFQQFAINVWAGINGDVFLDPYKAQFRLPWAPIYSFT